MTEIWPDRKQGVRFGALYMCGLVKLKIFSPNHTPKTHQTVHPVSYRAKFLLLIATLNFKKSRLLPNKSKRE